MADITRQVMTPAGDELSWAAATEGGDEFTNAGCEILLVNNGGASPVTVTITAQGECAHGVKHDGGGAVAAGKIKQFGLFQASRFNDLNGKVQVGYSAVTSVTVAVQRTQAI